MALVPRTHLHCHPEGLLTLTARSTNSLPQPTYNMDRFKGAAAWERPYVAGNGSRGRTGALLNKLDGILVVLESDGTGVGRS